MPRVALIIGEHDPFESRPYIVKRFIPIWRTAGVEVVVARGHRRRIDADAAFLHVDLTQVPEPYLALAASYKRSINARCASIDKRRIGDAGVRRGDGYAGPVIVKTTLNARGLPERETRRAAAGPLARWWLRRTDRLAHRAPWWVTGQVASYPVYDRRADVPASVWYDPRFVVQRFVTDRADGQFVVRRWYAMGPAAGVCLCYGRSPHLDGRAITHRVWIDDPPPSAVVAARDAFALDFCKIDYLTSGNETVVIDVNKTVGSGPLAPDVAAELDRRIAPGLLDLI